MPCWSFSSAASTPTETRSCASWSTSSTSATTTTFIAARFACAATSSRSFPHPKNRAPLRVEFFGDEVERISEVDPLRGKKLRELDRVAIYPASHYVTQPDQRKKAIDAIREELREHLEKLRRESKLLEAQRVEQRTMYDLELLEEMGFCPGIENYSRHLTNRAEGDPPLTLINYFPDDFVTFIDESHVTVPQIGGMYRGDRSRKSTLVEFGFPPAVRARQPAAELLGVRRTESPVRLRVGDARRLRARTVAGQGGRAIDSPHGPDRSRARGAARRTTGRRPARPGPRSRAERDERVLVTTLTKKMAEDLTEYFLELGVRVRYLHSDIDTIERVEIIRDLRKGVFDVLVGINLLREGLDLPEVSLVAILDADKEGFLRSERSLIQTIGRAARHLHGKVILYADRVTDSMRAAIDETNRRRGIQRAYNEQHGITPQTIIKAISESLVPGQSDYLDTEKIAEEVADYVSVEQIPKKVEELRVEMRKAAADLEFERAADLRDQIKRLQELELGLR